MKITLNRWARFSYLFIKCEKKNWMRDKFKFLITILWIHLSRSCFTSGPSSCSRFTYCRFCLESTWKSEVMEVGYLNYCFVITIFDFLKNWYNFFTLKLKVELDSSKQTLACSGQSHQAIKIEYECSDWHREIWSNWNSMWPWSVYFSNLSSSIIIKMHICIE